MTQVIKYLFVFLTNVVSILLFVAAAPFLLLVAFAGDLWDDPRQLYRDSLVLALSKRFIPKDDK